MPLSNRYTESACELPCKYTEPVSAYSSMDDVHEA